MSSAFDFTNKSVVVTGASRGIGYGVAEAFARHGAEVHLLASGEGSSAERNCLLKRISRQILSM